MVNRMVVLKADLKERAMVDQKVALKVYLTVGR
jgi:hypothetical protein